MAGGLFAFRVQTMLTLPALGVTENSIGEYIRETQSRHAGFLTALLNSGNSSTTYDLRLVSTPSPSDKPPRIECVLLCKTADSESASNCPTSKDVLNLLNATFPEYWFEEVPSLEVAHYCSPFKINHVAAISRRASIEPLDSLRKQPGPYRAGFVPLPPEAEDSHTPDREILHIFPFVPTGGDFSTLAKLLLCEESPVVISTRVRPTALLPDEEGLLEEYIARCERYAQLSLGPATSNIARLQPTLKEQAQCYMQYLTKLLFGLKDNAGLLTIQVGSPTPLSRLLVETLGSLITQPAGYSQSTGGSAMVSYFCGGYELFDMSSSPEAAEAISTVEFSYPKRTSIPAGAERLPYLFDSIEATAAFRLPPATMEAMPGGNAQSWKTLSLPSNWSSSGVLIGVGAHPLTPGAVRLGKEARKRHVYVIGQTGTGKTTLLKSMIQDDMRSGGGLCVIDPHGDLYHDLLEHVPSSRKSDVVLLDPSDTENPVGINMLEYREETERHYLVQEMVSIIQRMLFDEYGSYAANTVGPVFHMHMRMNLLLAMSNPADPGTLLEFHSIFQQKDYWKRGIPLSINDPLLMRWVESVLSTTDYIRQGSENLSMGSYVGSKFEGFVFDPRLRRMFGQKHSTIDFRRIMDSGKILLVNLSKGLLSDINANFLGMVLMAKFGAAAMSRVTIPVSQRRVFHLYVDEFQSIATQGFVTLLSEARKFGLNLVLANQFLSQIQDKRIVDSIFGNVGTLISFRLGESDAERLEHESFPYLNRFDFVNLPNWQAYVSTIVDGQNQHPFSIKTVPLSQDGNEKVAADVLRRSRRMYSRPRRLVDLEILGSIGGNTRKECLRAIRDEGIDSLCLGKTTTRILKSTGLTHIRHVAELTSSEIEARTGLSSNRVLNLRKVLNRLGFNGRPVHEDSPYDSGEEVKADQQEV